MKLFEYERPACLWRIDKLPLFFSCMFYPDFYVAFWFKVFCMYGHTRMSSGFLFGGFVFPLFFCIRTHSSICAVLKTADHYPMD